MPAWIGFQFINLSGKIYMNLLHNLATKISKRLFFFNINVNFFFLVCQCDFPDMVPDCDAEAYLRFTCPQQSQNLGYSTGETKFHRSDDCQRYFLCIDGRPRLYVCGVGTAFDESVNRCEAAENVTGCAHLAVTEEPEKQPIYLKTLKIKT